MIENAYDAQLEFEEEGLVSNWHPKAPDGRMDGQLYCLYCDTMYDVETRKTWSQVCAKANQHFGKKSHKNKKAAWGI